jgi:hypothetical protein
MKVNSENVNIEFECEECGKKERCNIPEAVFNGIPICLDCNTENLLEADHMVMLDCYIEEK